MIPSEILYTMKEIELATGVKRATLNSRRQRLGIPANRDGYTLEEVKRMLKRRPVSRPANEQRAARLRQALKNDGAI